jgi:oxygen-independent coproporphyrinogen-3 oxidase
MDIMNALHHVYVHVPFCSGKCLYCNFYSKLHNHALGDQYIDSLQREIEAAVKLDNIQPETLYIGGGTPTTLPNAQLERLLNLLQSTFNLKALKEWTIEGNPNTFTEDKIAILRKSGINRVSVGVQSMDDEILTAINRRHTVADTHLAMARLREGGIENIGIDLIACLPQVDMHMWETTLDAVIQLNTQHLSVYALSCEHGSKLHKLKQQNLWTHPKAEDEDQALDVARQKMTEAGFQRYETSNYALPNRRCMHNEAVWSGEEYIGFGPSAASRRGLKRWNNNASLNQYCAPPQQGASCPKSTETLSPETDAAERFMFTFRLCDGVNPHHFAKQHGFAAQKALPKWLNVLKALEKEGHAERHGERWALTASGQNYADTVAECLLP